MTARPFPPPHRDALIRTASPRRVWQCLDDEPPGLWFSYNPVDERPETATWTVLAAGDYGPIDLLVPVPYTEPGDSDPARIPCDRLVEHVLAPIATMLQQVASAAGAGIAAIVAEAYRRGVEDRAHTDHQAAQ